jgi:hypothetical protein
MKKLVSLLILFFSLNSYGQESLDYLNQVSELQNDISKKYLSYISAVSHGKSARKVENKRIDLINTVKISKAKAVNMHAFKGDLSLKDALKSYLDIVYNVLNEDYGKIVNLEEVAEQSYDAMEALFMAQDLAGKKANEAFEKFSGSYNLYAKNNKINLVESKSAFSEKLLKSSQVDKYYHSLYLLFFKSFKQEDFMIEAQNRKNISGIEQNKNALEKYAKQVLVVLDTTKAFMNDRSMVIVLKELMAFYVDEASKSKVITDYILKEESFAKMSKAFNAKSTKSRTQADVDNYNKMVNELNAAMNDFNALNNDFNKKRSSLTEKWNKTTSKFLDYHMPKY